MILLLEPNIIIPILPWYGKHLVQSKLSLPVFKLATSSSNFSPVLFAGWSQQQKYLKPQIQVKKKKQTNTLRIGKKHNVTVSVIHLIFQHFVVADWCLHYKLMQVNLLNMLLFNACAFWMSLLKRSKVHFNCAIGWKHIQMQALAFKKFRQNWEKKKRKKEKLYWKLSRRRGLFSQVPLQKIWVSSLEVHLVSMWQEWTTTIKLNFSQHTSQQLLSEYLQDLIHAEYQSNVNPDLQHFTGREHDSSSQHCWSI